MENRFARPVQELVMTDPNCELWYGCRPCPASAYHSHDFYEILFCARGSMQYLMGTAFCELEQGDLVVIPPGVGHRPIPLRRKDTAAECYGLWASAEFGLMLASQFPDFPIPSREPRFLRNFGRSKPAIQAFHRGLEAVRNQPPLWQSEMLAESIRILVEIGRGILNAEEVSPSASMPPRLVEILAYIDENLSQKLTLEQLAGRFFVSKGSITQMFRSCLDISFYQYVLKRRLVEAKNLIAEDLPLEQVASEVGFSSYSNFYRAFVNEYHIPPSRYTGKRR